MQGTTTSTAPRVVRANDVLPSPTADALLARRVRLLYAQALNTTGGGAFAAVIITILIWPHLPKAALTAWWLVGAVLYAVRYGVVRRFRSKMRAVDELPKWLTRYAAMMLGNGILWGSMGTLAAVFAPQLEAISVTLIIVGMATVSIAVVAPHTLSYGLLAGPMLAPAAAAFAVRGGVAEIALGAVLLVGLGALLLISRRWGKLMVESIEAGMINRQLARSLMRERSRTKEATLTLETVAGERARIELALSEERERAHVTLEAIADAVVSTDRDGIVDYLNPRAEELTGWTLAEAAGRPVREIVVIGSERTNQPIDLDTWLRDPAAVQPPDDLVVVRRDGVLRLSVAVSVAPIEGGGDSEEADMDAAPGGMVLVLHDQTEIRNLNRKMRFQASHDGLTHLMSRREFERRLQSAVVSRKADARHALMFMDLDKFKVLNDTCGHAAGDHLLTEIARRIQTAVGDAGIAGRIGGDEFAVLMRDTDEHAAASLAHALVGAVTEYRLAWGGDVYAIGASVGMVMIDSGELSAAQLLSNADAACYLAKDQGGGVVYRYSAADPRLAEQQLLGRWLTRLQAALAEDRLLLYVQPIMPVRGTSEDERMGEILLRMRGDDDEIIPPGAFIAAAERYRMMPEIDRFVVTRVIERLQRDRGAAPYTTLNVNLSGQSLSNYEFHRFLEAALDAASDCARWLCFEVTESAVMSNVDEALAFMRRIGERGCRFALDDFGSGLSSLTYLKRLPVDFLKIDGSFIREISSSEIDFRMVESVANWSRVLGIRTVAEYVEDPRVLGTLAELRIDFAQGFAIGRPAPFEPPAVVEAKNDRNRAVPDAATATASSAPARTA
ncbi:MAG: EAL domain-containing protein [Chromatiales bacterium]|nr:EAL domain-containing protein [Chromatiales bacterium]